MTRDRLYVYYRVPKWFVPRGSDINANEMWVKLQQYRYLSDNAARSVLLLYVAPHESN